MLQRKRNVNNYVIEKKCYREKVMMQRKRNVNNYVIEKKEC